MTWYVSMRREREAQIASGGLVASEECLTQPAMLESGAIRFVRVIRRPDGEPFQHIDTIVAAGEWIDFYEATNPSR